MHLYILQIARMDILVDPMVIDLCGHLAEQKTEVNWVCYKLQSNAFHVVSEMHLINF